MLLEIVAILNEKEAIDRQAISEQEVKKYAELMLEELYGMNSIQNDVEKVKYFFNRKLGCIQSKRCI